MKELLIEPTSKTPFIHLRKGKLLIKGRSISEDPRNFYASSLMWAKQYSGELPPETEINIKLEYSDTKSIKMIYEIILILITAARGDDDCKVTINWHCEKGDGEMMEQGEVLQSELGTKFNFIEYK